MQDSPFILLKLFTANPPARIEARRFAFGGIGRMEASAFTLFPSTEAVRLHTQLLKSGSAVVVAESPFAGEARIKKKPRRSGAKEAGLWSREVRKRCPTRSLGKAKKRNL